MASDERRPPERIEHDHTRIDVLFEDLGATARLVVSQTVDADLLEDSRQTWRHLLEELLGHFGREEHLLFRPLALQEPALSDALQQVTAQHTVLRNMLQVIGNGLLSDGEAFEALASSFDAQWQALQQLWDEHSALEWQLLEPLRVDVVKP